MSRNFEIGGIFKALQESHVTTKSKKKKKKKAKNNDSDSPTDIKSIDEENENAIKETLDNLFTVKPDEGFEEVDEDDEEYQEYINATEEKEKENKDNVRNMSTESLTKTIKKEKPKKKTIIKDDPEKLSRTLFVGNVALNVSRKKLKKLFMKFGDIETIRIRSVPTADPKLPKKVALIKKSFHSERNNMNAYIVFKSKDDADKAMTCHGALLEGLHLRVDKCENKQHDHKKCLFVGNLPFNVSEEDLRQHFTDCGDIEDIRLVRDKATGIGKGFGYVRFKSSDGVTFGLKLNGSTFKERPLRVYRSREQPTQQTGRARDKNNFSGLRATSKKDRVKGKKLIGQMQSSTKKPHNAMRRIQGKQLQQKHSKNKQRNINRKVNKNPKEKKFKK
ncbi:RNA-binding protein 34-like [Hydractinia symbiolongicarpus]|uniref:RNA-binding protein 34-like n=1 Tax=Hydractinia symbiolongicarpus TaxID=13093 RepID=UPI00254C517A|nr:RNA-binding protein 34-like [Hydractinia symbiolongicarpus]